MTAPVRLRDAASLEAVLTGLDPACADTDLAPALARVFSGFEFRIARIDDDYRLGRVFLMTRGHWVEAEIGQAIAAGRRGSAPACPIATPARCRAGLTSLRILRSAEDGRHHLRAPVSDPETRRALQLDTLSAILPMERRDRLAELLTDDDVATLKHLAHEGMGENSLRALASDLAYLEAWAQAATGAALPWPASESLALKFVAHHLWDPARRETDPQHGMPADVAAQLRESRCSAQHRPACAFDGQAAARKLGHLASLERAGGSVPLAQSARRAAARGSRQHTPASAQEQARSHPRRPGPSARHLPVRPAG